MTRVCIDVSKDTAEILLKLVQAGYDAESCESGVCDHMRQPPFYVEEPLYLEAIDALKQALGQG